MDPAQYIVGGRSFGTIFLWVLLAGEIYTTFTFLGIAGLSYSAGAPAFYVIAYGACAYVIGYFLTPAMWRVAKEFNLLTGPDFFETRYNSRALGVATAILYFLMVVPYVALQLSGLQILLRIAGYGAYDATVSVCVAFLVLALFVFTAGLRGTAWASIVKDVLVLGAVLFAGIAIPVRFFGSPSAMFDRVLAQHPKCSRFPQAAPFMERSGLHRRYSCRRSASSWARRPLAPSTALAAKQVCVARRALALLSSLHVVDDLRRSLGRDDRTGIKRNRRRPIVSAGRSTLLSAVDIGAGRCGGRARCAHPRLGAAARRLGRPSPRTSPAMHSASQPATRRAHG